MIRRITQTVGELFITAGVFLLLFVVWQLWWTTVVAEKESREVTNNLTQQWGTTAAAPAAPKKTAPATAPPPAVARPGNNEVFGIIHIPRFGSSWDPRPIIQGVDPSDLKKGVGHYPETVMPGGMGNFSVAGHRTTYGAPLQLVAELRKNDAVVVEMKQGYFTYRVTQSQIVHPTQVSVVAPVPDRPSAKPTQRMLTMTSCHPMYSARQRFIVHARFESFTPRANGRPLVLTGGK